MEQVLIQAVAAAEAVETIATVKAKEAKEVLAANGDRVNFTTSGNAKAIWISYVSKENAEKKKGIALAANAVRTETMWAGVVFIFAEEETTVTVQELTQKNRTTEDLAFEPKAPTVVQDGPGFSNAPSTTPGAGE